MSEGTALFSGRIGLLRILTIVIGVLDLALSADSLFLSYPLEVFFVIIVCICLLVSCLNVLVQLLLRPGGHRWRSFDIYFHVLGSIGLFLGGVCMLTNVFRFSRSQSQMSMLRRISAGISGITNSFVYVSVALLYSRS